MDLTHKYETAEQRKQRFLTCTTLHELLGIAIEDFETTLLMPDKYVIDMREWHVPAHDRGYRENPEDKCMVCLAGSVLAQSYGMAPDQNYMSAYRFLADEGKGIHDKLSALNNLRTGEVGAAAFSFYGDEHMKNYDRFPMPKFYYRQDGVEDFVTALKELQQHLLAKGL